MPAIFLVLAGCLLFLYFLLLPCKVAFQLSIHVPEWQTFYRQLFKLDYFISHSRGLFIFEVKLDNSTLESYETTPKYNLTTLCLNHKHIMLFKQSLLYTFLKESPLVH